MGNKKRVHDMAVASNPDTPVSELNRLSSDSFFEIRRAVAGNPSTPGYILESIIFEEERPAVLRAIASRPDITEWQFEMICRCSNQRDVRLAILRNPNVPVHIIENVAQDEMRSEYLTGVLSTIIRHPKLPYDLLCRLASCENYHCRIQVAQNSDNLFLVEQLTKDENQYVSRVAKKRLENLARSPKQLLLNI